jgi:hypothetical protein
MFNGIYPKQFELQGKSASAVQIGRRPICLGLAAYMQLELFRVYVSDAQHPDCCWLFYLLQNNGADDLSG